jgi:predicted PurR-regulated permease PerM
MAIVLGSIGFLLYAFVSPISEQAHRLEEKIPEAVNNARTWLHRQQAEINPLSPPEKAPTSAAPATNWLDSALAKAKTAVTGIASGLSLAVIVFVIGLFFVHEPDLYRRELRSLVARENEGVFDELWTRLGKGLRHWVGGISIAMALMGCFCAFGLWLAGVQNWFLLGTLTFFGTFIPYAGAIASAVPGLLMALSQSKETFLLACLVYLGVHILEGYIVQPLIMKRAVTLPPATLLIWQFAMGLIGGPLGIVVATPLFVCLKIAVDYLYVERKLGKQPFPKMPDIGPSRAARKHSA